MNEKRVIAITENFFVTEESGKRLLLNFTVSRGQEKEDGLFVCSPTTDGGNDASSVMAECISLFVNQLQEIVEQLNTVPSPDTNTRK